MFARSLPVVNLVQSAWPGVLKFMQAAHQAAALAQVCSRRDSVGHWGQVDMRATLRRAKDCTRRGMGLLRALHA
eukprot:6112624-Alexandrium_andersonii.AAC.1